MRSLLLLLLVAAVAQCPVAQTIDLSALRNPDRPVVFNDTVRHKAVLLFYPQKMMRTRDYAVHVVELDPATLATVRTGPPAQVSGEGIGEDDHFRVLCHYQRGDAYFAVLEVNNECRIYRIDAATLAFTLAGSFRADEDSDERLLAAAAYEGQGYVLSRIRSRKTGNRLAVYRLTDDGKAERHEFAVPARAEFAGDKSNSVMFDRSFKVLGIEHGTEPEPEISKRPGRFFAGDNKVWLTLDHTAAVGAVNLAYFKVYTLDLATDSLSTYASMYLPRPQQGRRQNGSTYLLDDKLFQLYVDNDNLALLVRRLADGELLYERFVQGDEPLDFVNSPVVLPGRGALGIEKEYKTARKFINEVFKYDSYLLARRAGSDYLLSIGGYLVVNNPGPMSMGPGGMGMMRMGAGYSYDRSFGFYSALQDQPSWQHSSTQYKKTLLQAYTDTVEIMTGERDEALYAIGNRYYLGWYDRKTDSYRLKQLKGF
jgi:hypothetical protein